MRFNVISSAILAVIGATPSLAIPTAVEIAERASPTGINNQGSFFCRKGSMAEIVQFVNRIPDCLLFRDGIKLACSGIHGANLGGGGTCAFFQGTGQTYTGAEAKRLVRLLSQHQNTLGCGSIPVTFPPEKGGINNFAKGMLTVNFVRNTDNPCPPGPCTLSSCVNSRSGNETIDATQDLE